MIIDTLDNLAQYEAVNPLFKDVVDFLKKDKFFCTINYPSGFFEEERSGQA